MATGTPLKVWFVNVGHGDCTIVKFPSPSGRVMMVDICNSKVLDKETAKELLELADLQDAFLQMALLEATGTLNEKAAAAIRRYSDLLEDPIDVMKRELPGEDIFRFVLTHPDMDHMTGLYRLFRQEDGIGVQNFWDTDNTKKATQKSGIGYDQQDWEEYQRIRKQDVNPRVLRLYRGAAGDFYAQDNIQILSPTPDLMKDCNAREDWNNMSQVLRITHGESSLLLPGDVEEKAQRAMLAAYPNGLKSTILKAPHHGRDSGYCSDFAKAVSPAYTIVSVGKKDPDCDASSKYRHHSGKVYSTRFRGTIKAYLYEDGDVEMWDADGTRIDDGAVRMRR